jgi:type III restriction enzyme
MSTGTYKIDKLIINSPYEIPKEHWGRVPMTRSVFRLYPTRREAGYMKATESKGIEDTGVFIPIPLVNDVRKKVGEWRAADYPGVTGVTRRLLRHWYDPLERDNRFFFCQLEAIETIIWLAEAPESYKQGIEVPGDGGDFRRLCCKMATGTGKTTVMAMLIAWQILNKVTYPQDPRFTKYVFVLTPNLTIRTRLQVLYPDGACNYFDEFNVVPYDLKEKLRQGKVKVTNWHNLAWDSDEKIAKRHSVDKRGAKSDEAYVREVLGELSAQHEILIINDEAHHAWRRPAGFKGKLEKEEEEMATVWINGLDRIHKARGILTCYDFTATPFAPTGRTSPEDTLYKWIISDFNLNDAIESGLVKTPRIVFRDDANPDKELRSKLYHIYSQPEVHSDLNRIAKPEEPLPKLVENAYWLLGEDWRAAYLRWKEAGYPTPPVMITVANRTETAARIKFSFDNNLFHIDELADPSTTIHIDSKILKADREGDETALQEVEEIEANEENIPEKKLSKKEREMLERAKVDTVGKKGKPGEKIRNVISVGMLSEGWDAKTVTHIMGLRAFSSQLLCEQVVGRGLRRTSYEVGPDGLFQAEYVNIFGIPFSFLPHETAEGSKTKAPEPGIAIEPVPEKKNFEIRIPNLVRVDHVYNPTLTLDMEKLPVLVLDAMEIRTLADLAPMINGQPDISKFTTIRLKELAERNRTQRLIFEASKRLYDQMKDEWKGGEAYLIAQLIHIFEEFLKKGKIKIKPPEWGQDELKRRILLTLSLREIVVHIYQQIIPANTSKLVPIYNEERPIIFTGDMHTWHTTRKHTDAIKSHINYAVYDSSWEATEAFELDRNPNVEAWVKNDHLGFDIHYLHAGIVHKYRPDYVINLADGTHLVLEVKGQPTQQDFSKELALEDWVTAVNNDKRFGKWAHATSTHPKDIPFIIEKIIKGLPIPSSDLTTYKT